MVSDQLILTGLWKRKSAGNESRVIEADIAGDDEAPSGVKRLERVENATDVYLPSSPAFAFPK